MGCTCSRKRETSTLDDPLIEMGQVRIQSFHRYGSHLLNGYKYDRTITRESDFTVPRFSITHNDTPSDSPIESSSNSVDGTRPGRLDSPYPYSPNSVYAELDGYHGSLDSKQSEALQKLKDSLVSQELNYKAWLNPQEHEDTFLLRFLRARKFKVPDAYSMMEQDIAWRVDTGVKKIRHKEPSELLEHDVNEISALNPITHHGYDKCGRPIVVQQLGPSSASKLLKIVPLEAYLRYHVWKNEMLAQLCVNQTRNLGQHIENFCVIIDCKGSGLKTIGSSFLTLVKAVAKIDQDHYPERLGVLYIINAPRLFPSVWGAIKPFIDPRTVSKIQIVAKNFQKVLLENISVDTLPPEYGGHGQRIGEASDLMSAFRNGSR